MKILLPVDGSPNSIRAAEYAADIAERIGESSVTIIYVDNLKSVVINIIGAAGSGINLEHILDEQKEEAMEDAEKIFKQRSIPYTAEYIEHSDAAEAICEYAEKNDFEQIIMGTRGYSGIRGMVMGSVSHKVLYLAPCPVTFVK